MSALANLIDAIEAGAVTSVLCAEAFPLGSVHGYPVSGLAMEAAYGSIDDAHALHRVLLPGWLFEVSNRRAFVMRDLPDADLDGRMCPKFHGESDVPARAWLLAILRAKLAEDGE